MLKVVGASWMKIRMSTWIIGIVLVLGIIVVILGQMGQLEQDGNYSATAYWNQETGFEIKFWGQGLEIEEIPTGVARAYFQPHIDTTGWAIIDIETQLNCPDWVQAYAAGMLEGSLSWQLIYWHWKNTVQNICANQKLFCNYVKTYLEENLVSIKKHYKDSDDPYWHQVYLYYIQLEGMKEGFEHGVKRSRQTIEELENVDFLWMNAASDIVDLEYKFYDSKPYVREDLNFSEVQRSHSDSAFLKRLRDLHSDEGFTSENRHDEVDAKRILGGCGASLGSSFVKLLASEGKLLVAHNTASPYVSMLRMIKSYLFRYRWSAANFWTLENKLTFSSYPGAIQSMDDFYVISKGNHHTKMVVAGTPITVFTKNLWKHVSPLDQVLSGLRTVVASRLASNASSWTSYLSRYNSGTGNKQWVVVDVDRFRNISRLKSTNERVYQQKLTDAKGILWVAEQLPATFIMADQTDILREKTYWASYGLPFYENVTTLSGTNEMLQTFGNVFSYAECPFAKIYQRDHTQVHSTKSLMSLMRSNSYRKDPLSMGNPRCAIGARGDLPNGLSFSFPIGVIDSKVFSIDGSPPASTTRPPDRKPRDESVLEHEKWFLDRDQGEQGRHFLAVAGPAHSLVPGRKQKLTSSSEPGNEKPETEVNTKAEDDTEQSSDEDVLHPFDWAHSLFNGFPHNGHPDTWDFEPVFLPV